MIKQVKDITLEEVKQICIKARTKENGKVVKYCVSDCPLNKDNADMFLLFDNSIRLCELIKMLNKEVEIEDGK